MLRDKTVQRGERAGRTFAEMHHAKLSFVNGVFKGALLDWSVVDREGHAIVATFQRLEYLLWGDVLPCSTILRILQKK